MNIEIEDYYGHPLVRRYGHVVPNHKGMEVLFEEKKSSYLDLINEFSKHMEAFLEISWSKEDEINPHWHNYFLPSLDIITIFGFMALNRPKIYFEIGSGNSTKVAYYAKQKLKLETKIYSIDPSPQAEIDGLCDRIIRKPLENCDLSFIHALREGDIFYFDGSHRVLQNSDNEVLFFELIPRLRENVLIHIHDICWPEDYPTEWNKRMYSEQYVLGAMLLYAPEMFDIIFPSAYVSWFTDYTQAFRALWERPGFEKMEHHGSSFWFKKKGSNKALKAT
jgi:hypothetical protein